MALTSPLCQLLDKCFRPCGSVTRMSKWRTWKMQRNCEDWSFSAHTLYLPSWQASAETSILSNQLFFSIHARILWDWNCPCGDRLKGLIRIKKVAYLQPNLITFDKVQIVGKVHQQRVAARTMWAAATQNVVIYFKFASLILNLIMMVNV